MVTKMLPITNLTPPRSLVVSQVNTKGISEPIPYGLSPGDSTLTPDGSLTSLVVLQVNPMPITLGLTPLPDHQVANMTAATVTHVL